MPASSAESGYIELFLSFVALHPEHAMLWMLKQNPQLQKIALCLDNDAAGQKAVERLTGILQEHGYPDVTPMLPQAKDWNDELWHSEMM